MPLYLAVGNHDDRQALRAAFPKHTHLAGEDGFVQYAVEDFDVRLVVLDTLIPRKPGGMLCEKRLRWLDRTLAASNRPTIVAQHHPPFATGLSFMDRMSLVDPGAEAAVISKYPQVERGDRRPPPSHRAGALRRHGGVDLPEHRAPAAARPRSRRRHPLHARAVGLPAAPVGRRAAGDAHPRWSRTSSRGERATDRRG